MKAVGGKDPGIDELYFISNAVHYHSLIALVLTSVFMC